MIKKSFTYYVVVALVGIMFGASIMVGCSGRFFAKPNPQETSQIANLNQPVNMAGVSDCS